MSITFSKFPKFTSCATTPSRRLASEKLSSISISKIFTEPEDLFTKEPTMPIVDDLPAPLGPRSAKKSPS